MPELCTKKCVPCEGGTPTLETTEINKLLTELNGWTFDDTTMRISRTVDFKGYGKTMAFVNAVAWIAHQEAHHPDMEVSYNCCIVHYTTHAIKGLSENDFICAAKVDALL